MHPIHIAKRVHTSASSIATLASFWVHKNVVPDIPGEGMVELYNELRQPIDSCIEERQLALQREKQEEEADLRSNQFGIAVVGLPNVVCLYAFSD